MVLVGLIRSIGSIDEKSHFMNRERSLSTWIGLDYVGSVLGFLCAIHCASLPFLAIILPIHSMGYLLNHEIEIVVILSSFIIGLSSIWHGYRHHYTTRIPIGLFLLGFTLLLVAYLYHESNSILVTLMRIYGGGSLSLAHLLNWRLSKTYNIACSCNNARKIETELSQ